MKFYNYINENNFEKVNQDVKDRFIKDCDHYIKELINMPNPLLLYSGRKDAEIMINKQVRKNRIPKDTPLELHNKLDDEFQKQMGIRPRSGSLFAIADRSSATSYGTPYYIFPVGRNYKFITSKDIDDLYDHIKMAVEKYLSEMFNNKDQFARAWTDNTNDEEFQEYINNTIRDMVKTYNIITDLSKLKIYYDVEIMLMCDEVWMINSRKINNNLLLDFLEGKI